MTAGQYDLQIETNAAFEISFFYRDDDAVDEITGEPIPLTGFTPKVEFASAFWGDANRVVFYTLTTSIRTNKAGLILNAANGQVDMYIPYSDCIQFAFDAVWDLIFVANDDPDYVWRFLKGAVLLDKGVTVL